MISNHRYGGEKTNNIKSYNKNKHLGDKVPEDFIKKKRERERARGEKIRLMLLRVTA